MIYVFLCVVLMNKLLKFQWVTKVLEWISLCVIVGLALVSLASAIGIGSTITPRPGTFVTPFISGLILMIINPVQIPFWLGWTTILYEKKVLKAQTSDLITYVLGSGLGSLCASLLFVMAGDFLSRQIAATGHLWHYMLTRFFISALVQLRNILSKRSTRLNARRVPGVIKAQHQNN